MMGIWISNHGEELYFGDGVFVFNKKIEKWWVGEDHIPCDDFSQGGVYVCSLERGAMIAK